LLWSAKIKELGKMGGRSYEQLGAGNRGQGAGGREQGAGRLGAGDWGLGAFQE